MGKKDNEPKPAADLDLTEPLPEGLGGQPEDRDGGSYVPATRRDSMSLQTEGDSAGMSMEGVRPPYLSLVHGTSQELLEKGFNAGDLVLRKEFAVAARGKKLQAIILAYDEYVKERLSQDQWAAKVQPRTFKTMQDAANAGLCTVWDDAKGLRPEAGPAMDLVMLIKRNEGVSDALFGVDLGIQEEGRETDWGFALLSLDKGGCKVFKSDVALTVNGKLKKTGIYSGLWELNTELAPPSKKSTNRPFVIRARFKGMLDPVVVENIKGAMSVPVSSRDEDAGDTFP